MFIIVYSQTKKDFKIKVTHQMINENITSVFEKSPNDYIVIGFAETQKLCFDWIKEFSKDLKKYHNEKQKGEKDEQYN